MRHKIDFGVAFTPADAGGTADRQASMRSRRKDAAGSREDQRRGRLSVSLEDGRLISLGMAYCKACGRPLVVRSGVNKCAFCGKKKGLFQSAETGFTRSGTAKKANRAVRREVDRAAKQVAKEYGHSPGGEGTGAMTWQVAEAVARDWMRANGHRDAKLTKSGADGGVDVVSSKAVAQVKHQSRPVRLPEVQRIFGIAVAERKRALIFASSGFTAAARAWATAHDVECYVFPPVRRVR